MKLAYDPETDSRYIDLVGRPSAGSLEVSPGVVLDLGRDGYPVGFDIQHASRVADLSRLDTEALPVGDAVTRKER